MKKIKLLLSTLILITGVVSCSSDDDSTSTNTSNLNLAISGLENLGDDYVYEGWVITTNGPVSTGVFSVDDSGALSSTDFTVDQTSLDGATTFVLTIEPVGETAGSTEALTPSNTKILSGAFDSSTASLSITDQLGDFSTASANFILATPTDNSSNTNNNENGIWFFDPTNNGGTTGLNLPTLPEGWAYEGWVVDGGPVTTGTFTDFSSVDNLAPFSGSDGGPSFPGEDFLIDDTAVNFAGVTIPLDVREKTVVISIEPVPDNSPSPFLLKPLTGTAGTTLGPDGFSTNTLTLNSASFPTGTVTR